MLHVVPHSFPTRRSSDLGVVTTGTIRLVDTATRVVNLSHGPIPAIGWPAMTMDFNVAPEVNLSSVQPGPAVRVTLVPAAGGAYTVSAIETGSCTRDAGHGGNGLDVRRHGAGGDPGRDRPAPGQPRQVEKSPPHGDKRGG